MYFENFRNLGLPGAECYCLRKINRHERASLADGVFALRAACRPWSAQNAVSCIDRRAAHARRCAHGRSADEHLPATPPNLCARAVRDAGAGCGLLPGRNAPLSRHQPGADREGRFRRFWARKQRHGAIRRVHGFARLQHHAADAGERPQIPCPGAGRSARPETRGNRGLLPAATQPGACTPFPAVLLAQAGRADEHAAGAGARPPLRRAEDFCLPPEGRAGHGHTADRRQLLRPRSGARSRYCEPPCRPDRRLHLQAKI